MYAEQWDQLQRRWTIHTIALVLAGIVAILLPGFAVHIDRFPTLRTYGVTAGTDTHYCSIDWVRGAIVLSCDD